MKLLPRLVKTKMYLSFGERVELEGHKHIQIQMGRKELHVEEWVGVGLVIHEYVDEIGRRHNWRISHMESGRSILKHMRGREEAIEYLMKLRGVLKDWTMTEQQFQALPNRSEIKQHIDALQKSISGKRR